jgi:hypothetical protein
MVTVDPDRDTDEKLFKYLSSFSDKYHALVPQSPEELTAAKEKLSRAQMDGGEAMVKAEQEIANLKKENSSLRDEIATINQNLLYETEKRQSLEETMLNLTLGHEEQISREKAAAEERATQQREREMQHANELKEQEAKALIIETKLKDEFAKAQMTWKNAESTMQVEFSQTLRAKDIEIIPVYVRGERSLYSVYNGWSLIKWIQKKMLDNYKYPFPVIALGWYGSFWPKANPLEIYFGAPIKLGGGEHSTVDEVFETYCLAMETLESKKE